MKYRVVSRVLKYHSPGLKTTKICYPNYEYFSGAINQLTKNLACEWAKDNIRTNTVAPWAVRTSMRPVSYSFC